MVDEEMDREGKEEEGRAVEMGREVKEVGREVRGMATRVRVTGASDRTLCRAMVEEDDGDSRQATVRLQTDKGGGITHNPVFPF